MTYEYRKEFTSLSEWQTWHPSHPEISDLSIRQNLIAEFENFGFMDPITNLPAQGQDILIGMDLREGLLYRGLNSRMRAVWMELSRIQKELGVPDNQFRVYAPEALTEFALKMRGRYRYFLGSEFMPTKIEQSTHFPITHLDLENLDLPDGTFHAAICNEVFEHLPNLDKAMRELNRILKPGGVLIATFPFCVNQDASVVKARLIDGQIQYYGEPEFHGNPVAPESGALVFEIPGWDFLNRAISCGFSKAISVFIGSGSSGVLSSNMNGVFVHVFYR